MNDFRTIPVVPLGLRCRGLVRSRGPSVEAYEVQAYDPLVMTTPRTAGRYTRLSILYVSQTPHVSQHRQRRKEGSRNKLALTAMLAQGHIPSPGARGRAAFGP